MSSLSRTFDFDGRAVRVLGTQEAPLFVARDVCECLGISNVGNAVARLDDDEKGIRQTETPGGTQDVAVVTEAGLYELVIRSDKAEAKPFRRWVTHEVLPSIRRTGAFVDESGVLCPPHIAAGWYVGSQALKAAEGVPPALATKLLKYAEKCGARDLSEFMPRLPDRTFSATEVAEQLGISANKVGRLANAMSIKSDPKFCVVTLNQIEGSGYTKQVELVRYLPAGVEQLRIALEAEEASDA